MNKFILQLSLKNHQLENYVKALKYNNAEYTFYSIYSDNNLIENLPEDFTHNNYISFASIKGLKLSKSLSVNNFNNEEEFNKYSSTYKTSFFYEDGNRFDQKYYKNIGLPLLNANSTIIDLEKSFNLSFNRDVFIKPTSDLKAFVGGIMKSGTTIIEFLQNCQRMENWKIEPSLIAEVKDIHSEYRFFVVGDEVITGSRYMFKKEVLPSIDIPEIIWEQAHKLAKMYQPDRVFTMDLALLENGNIEIVEYNCFNGSGTYYAPLNDLIKRLMDFNIINQ